MALAVSFTCSDLSPKGFTWVLVFQFIFHLIFWDSNTFRMWGCLENVATSDQTKKLWKIGRSFVLNMKKPYHKMIAPLVPQGSVCSLSWSKPFSQSKSIWATLELTCQLFAHTNLLEKKDFLMVKLNRSFIMVNFYHDRLKTNTLFFLTFNCFLNLLQYIKIMDTLKKFLVHISAKIVKTITIGNIYWMRTKKYC